MSGIETKFLEELTFKNMHFPSFLISFLIFVCLNFLHAAKDVEELNPDQLQFLLNMAGEGTDTRPSESLDRAMQAGWSKETGFQRHLFIVAALDTLRQADGWKKTGRASRNKSKKYPRGKLALAGLLSANRIITQLETAEIDYMFKRFRYYEYEYLQQTYRSRHFHVKDRNSFLRAIIGGMFVHGLLPKQSLYNPSIAREWTKIHRPRLLHLIHLTFHQWLPFVEENAVIIDGFSPLGDDLLVLKEEVIKRGKMSLIPLAQTVSAEIAEKLLPHLPLWMANTVQSPLSGHLVLLAFKLQSLERALSWSTIHILKRDLKNRYGMDLDLPTEPLQKQFEKTFRELSKAKFKDLSRIVGKNLNFAMILRGVGIGSLIGLVADIAIESTGALINGQKMEEVHFGTTTVPYRPRSAQMQITGDQLLDKARNRAYAMGDLRAKYKRELLTRVAGTITWVGTYTVATPLILGAAAAAGLPSAGVGGALVVAGGYIVSATAATVASYQVRNALEPLQRKINQVVSETEIQTKLRLILSLVETSANKDRIINQTTEIMKNRQRSGHEVRFMGYLQKFDAIKLPRGDHSLVFFEIDHRAGNLLQEVQINPLGPRNLHHGMERIKGRPSQTRKEAHVRYDFFDAEGNMGAWDPWSNRVINLGLARVNHHHITFVGIPGDQISISGKRISGKDPRDDLRVLTNGTIMVRNEWTRKWEIRGNVENVDLYLRVHSPGRYTWNPKQEVFERILSGVDLKNTAPAELSQTSTPSPSKQESRGEELQAPQEDESHSEIQPAASLSEEKLSMDGLVAIQ